MAPDFEYFFGLTRPVSHSFPGVFTFTLPLAMVVLVLFHSVVKWPLISLLPHALQARLVGPARRFRWGPPSRWLWLLLSLGIGIATHLFFDSFTHREGWAVDHWSVLRFYVTVFHRHMHISYLLQYILTALGAGLLVVSFALWYKRAQCSAELPRRFSAATNWAILLAMAAGALIAGLVHGPEGVKSVLGGMPYRLRFVTGIVITTTAAAAAELFAFGILWRMFLAPRLQRDHATVKR